jgi:hypothetical protein
VPARAFHFESGSAGELRDLALTGGWLDGDFFLDGGAVLLEDDGGPDAEVTLDRVHVYGNETYGYGGGISNGGKLTVISSLIEGNKAHNAGGGIENDDQLTVVNSTISGNEILDAYNAEDAIGGGIDHKAARGDDPFVIVESSTITANHVLGFGGGIASSAEQARIRVRNSIVSGNYADAPESGNANANCSVAIESLGHNLEDGLTCGFTASGDLNADPKLTELANSGGPTNTHALPAGSPAIDAGSTVDCVESDQRGFARPAGPACDIGAFEFGAEPKAEQKPPPKDEEKAETPRDEQRPGPPVTPEQPRCDDGTAPLTVLKRRGVKVDARSITLKGSSRDAGGRCTPAGVERVEVSLAKVSGTELNCRFLHRPNRFVLTPFRNCRRPITFKARGTTAWRFTFKAALAPGKYRAQARGYDVARNKETPKKRRNIVYFEVK